MTTTSPEREKRAMGEDFVKKAERGQFYQSPLPFGWYNTSNGGLPSELPEYAF